MDRKKIILIIIGVVVLMGLVFVLGFSYGLERGREEVKIVEQPIPIIELLESPLLYTMRIVVLGKIKEIRDGVLVVAENNEVLEVPISPGASVTLFLLPEEVVEKEEPLLMIDPPQIIAFEDIRVNDKAEIILRVMPDGQIQGASIIIRRIGRIEI